ncbi:MAG: hypothetical protein DDT32_01092 [Syntrophomonadaceae bacterium]|nr:hypothetical protein [Bacillota bacterium]
MRKEGSVKPIYFTGHARRQMAERKASDEEVRQVIQGAEWQLAEKGRHSASLVFPFNAKHYGRFYTTKEVVPVFVEEADRIIVITAYTFFSKLKV